MNHLPSHNSKSQPQRIEIPAINLPFSGLKAEYHIIRHQKKLQDCPFDAGMDLYASEIEKVVTHCSTSVIWVHTFLIAHIGPGFCGEILPRSSSIDRLNGGEIVHGLIDAGYTGELMIRVKSPINRVEEISLSIVECAKGQIAIAQLKIAPSFVLIPSIMPLNPPPSMINLLPGGNGGRGTRGFGSTDLIK